MCFVCLHVVYTDLPWFVVAAIAMLPSASMHLACLSLGYFCIPPNTQHHLLSLSHPHQCRGSASGTVHIPTSCQLTKLNCRLRLNRRFIVVEGISQNLGDIAPLDQIFKLKERFKYRLVLDESLSFGVLGDTGRGAAEHFGLKPGQIEIVAASMGKCKQHFIPLHVTHAAALVVPDQMAWRSESCLHQTFACEKGHLHLFFRSHASSQC